MITGSTQTRPLACVPGAIAPEDRPAHFGLIARLFGSELRERRELVDGYAFRFDAVAFEDITRFVANERACCPFLDFTVQVRAEHSGVWLRLTGPEGTRAFLDAELPI